MNKNYTNLDALRSLAVLSVVAQHLWHQCVNVHLCVYRPTLNDVLANLSFTGVMFFFVHTCLVLMLSMQRAPEAKRGAAFLVRRAFRIYPLAWATVLLALATGLTDHPEATLQSLGWRGVTANLLLFQNMLRSAPSVVGPLWSLPWEVQMYLVLPLLFLLLRVSEKLYIALALWFGAMLLAVAATQPGLPRSLHATVFPPMFIAGMVAYKLLNLNNGEAHRIHLPAWTWPLFVCSLFGVESWLMRGKSFETPVGAAINSGICLVLAFGIYGFDQLASPWLTWPFQQIAKYSYGIYLLHVPVLILVVRHLHPLPLVLTIAVFLLLTIVVSIISFHVVEDPLIKVGRRLALTIQARSGRTRSAAPSALIENISIHPSCTRP